VDLESFVSNSFDDTEHDLPFVGLAAEGPE